MPTGHYDRHTPILTPEELRIKQRERNLRWRSKFTKEELRAQRLRRRYGITPEKADELYDSPCEICGLKKKVMHIDHKHVNGKQEPVGTYHGVLCRWCNMHLGWFELYSSQIMAYANKGDN